MPSVAGKTRKVICPDGAHSYCEPYVTYNGRFMDCNKCGHHVNLATPWVELKEFVTQWASFLVDSLKLIPRLHCRKEIHNDSNT